MINLKPNKVVHNLSNLWGFWIPVDQWVTYLWLRNEKKNFIQITFMELIDWFIQEIWLYQLWTAYHKVIVIYIFSPCFFILLEDILVCTTWQKGSYEKRDFIWSVNAQPAFSCLKSTVETIEIPVKSVQS